MAKTDVKFLASIPNVKYMLCFPKNVFYQIKWEIFGLQKLEIVEFDIVKTLKK